MYILIFYWRLILQKILNILCLSVYQEKDIRIITTDSVFQILAIIFLYLSFKCFYCINRDLILLIQ
jgi:hypothetical protein